MTSIQEAIENAKTAKKTVKIQTSEGEKLQFTLSEYDAELLNAFIAAEDDVDRDIKNNKINIGMHAFAIGAMLVAAVTTAKQEDISSKAKYITGGVTGIIAAANAFAAAMNLKAIKLLKEEKFCLQHKCDIDAICAKQK